MRARFSDVRRHVGIAAKHRFRVVAGRQFKRLVAAHQLHADLARQVTAADQKADVFFRNHKLR